MLHPAPVSVGFAPALSVCIVALLCLPGFCIALWEIARRHRRSNDSDLARIREVIDSNRTSCVEDCGALSRNLEALQASMQTADDLLRGGRLSNSCRAQALQLLRAGIAPDTAAATLGLARVEMRLLAKVSRLLTAA